MTTNRSLRSLTYLLLAGAALTASMGFAEPASADPDASAPAALGAVPAAQPEIQEPGYREAMKPEVRNLVPESGPVDTRVHILGTNLSSATKVLFGGSHDARFKVVNDTEIEATVPAGALPGPIEVETSAGTVKSGEPFVVAYQ